MYGNQLDNGVVKMSKIAWYVPSPMEGSGGHRTIFQNINALANMNHECHVYVEDQNQFISKRDLEENIRKYFGDVKAQFHLGFNCSDEYELAFATAWHTAKYVRDLPDGVKKAYFVQDFEAYFNPMGDGYLLAENSYKYNLIPVTIGKWLSNVMMEQFHTPAKYFDFCADHNVYKPLSIKKEKSICFIYQPEKPRRCSVIGIEALGIVKHLMPDVKIYLYGSKSKGNIWFEHENLELISVEKCNELYNKCSVGLCISSSNPSRIPFEMMAAGLPVVDIYRENNFYDLPDEGVKLADQTPESIAEAIIDLLNNSEERSKMSRFGIEFMKEKSLEHGYRQFTHAVEKILSNESFEEQTYDKIYNKPAVIADVFIHRVNKNINVNQIDSKQNKSIRRLKSIIKRVIGKK